jgi:outer membrane protein assembly factor BamE (lipoprotein component of BamABCDE complex)
MTIRALLIVFFIFVGVQGCIILTPEHGDLGTRRRLEKTTLDSILVGKTTREEVLLTLGEPGFADGDDRVFVYHWAMVGGYWGIGAYCSGAAGHIARRYLLVIEFDDHRIVKRHELKEPKHSFLLDLSIPPVGLPSLFQKRGDPW